MSCPLISRYYSHTELTLRFILTSNLIDPLLYSNFWAKTTSASTPAANGAKRKIYQSSTSLLFSSAV